LAPWQVQFRYGWLMSRDATDPAQSTCWPEAEPESARRRKDAENVRDRMDIGGESAEEILAYLEEADKASCDSD